MLILTNPDNPTGGIYTKDQLLALHGMVPHPSGASGGGIDLRFIITQHIPPRHQRQLQRRCGISFLRQHRAGKKSDYLHPGMYFVQGLRRLGLPRGMVYSLNTVFRAAFNNLSPPGMVSNYAQWTFEQVLSDHAFVKQYIQTNQQRLTENFATATRVLEGTPTYPLLRPGKFVCVARSVGVPEKRTGMPSTSVDDLYKTGRRM